MSSECYPNLVLDIERTSNDIIAGNGRKRFMIELKFLQNVFFIGTVFFFFYCLPCSCVGVLIQLKLLLNF